MTRSPRLHLAVAGVLIALFLALSVSASLQKSAAFDEPPHIASGLSYLDTHVFHANLQHPPLLKEMSALSLWMAGIHWPRTPLADKVIQGAPDGAALEWPVGNDIIATNGPDRVMFWARLPFILLAGLLGFLIYWWGRELVGSTAALGALFLYTVDPTILGHSYLVTTDVGLAAFSVLFLFALWRYLQQPVWWRLVLCGLAMGAMVCAKFSAVFVLPGAAILLVTTAGRRRVKTSILAFAGMCAIAVIVMEAIYFFPSDPLLYLAGLSRVNADHVPGHLSYLNGELASHFYSYFVAAYLLKEPLASVVLTGAGLAIVLSNRSTPLSTKLFLLLTPAVFVLSCTFLADDLGIRYIIPALPFACLLGGLALSSLFSGTGVWGRVAAPILCVWLVVEAVGIYPDHLSYFNEAACLLESPDQAGLDGGSRCGPLWLDDSNVDWGQGVKQLRTWMEHNGHGRPLRLAYFGTFPPERYGLAYDPVDEQSLMAAPPPGLYAVSAHWVARIAAAVALVAPGAVPWTQQTTPVAIVGHAFYIYDVH